MGGGVGEGLVSSQGHVQSHQPSQPESSAPVSPSLLPCQEHAGPTVGTQLSTAVLPIRATQKARRGRLPCGPQSSPTVHCTGAGPVRCILGAAACGHATLSKADLDLALEFSPVSPLLSFLSSSHNLHAVLLFSPCPRAKKNKTTATTTKHQDAGSFKLSLLLTGPQLDSGQLTPGRSKYSALC